MDKKNLLKKAYKYLSYRSRTKKEIERYLLKKTKNQSIIDDVISHLSKQGFVNDDDFIDQFINSYVKKGHGPKKIYFNLLKKGLNKKDISKKLDQVDENTWVEAGKKVILKKSSQIDRLKGHKKRQKIYNLLTYRGHNYSTIKRIIDAYPHLE